MFSFDLEETFAREGVDQVIESFGFGGAVECYGVEFARRRGLVEVSRDEREGAPCIAAVCTCKDENWGPNLQRNTFYNRGLVEEVLVILDS